jgi:hypothetical protein
MSILPDAFGTEMTPEEEKAEQAVIFVQQYIAHGNAMVACNRAGIHDPRYAAEVVAERYLKQDFIQVALAAFAASKAPDQPIEVTRDTLVADMQVVKSKALDDRQYGSVIAASKLQGLLLNLLTQNINVNHRHTVDTMSDAELMRIAAQGDRKIIDVDPDDVE